MKKWLIIPIFILLFGGLFVYLSFSLPTNETVKQEFLKQNPNAEIVNIELIFEDPQKNLLIYLIKLKEPNNDEILTDGLTIKQSWNFRWHWCSNQTERKCE